MTKKTTGVICILAASVMWGIEPLITRYVTTSVGLPLMATRGLIALVITVAYARLRRAPLIPNPRVDRRSFGVLAWNAIISGVIADLLFFSVMNTVPVVNVVILAHMQPLIILLLGVWILRTESIRRSDLIGIALMILSAIAVTGKTIEAISALSFGTLGDLLILICAFLWSTSTMLSKTLPESISAGTIASSRFVIGLPILLALLIFTGESFSTDPWVFALGTTSGIGMLLYFEGLIRLKAAQITALELTSVLFSAVGGVLLFHEIPSVLQILGIFGLAGGVLLLAQHEAIPTESHQSL